MFALFTAQPEQELNDFSNLIFVAMMSLMVVYLTSRTPEAVFNEVMADYLITHQRMVQIIFASISLASVAMTLLFKLTTPPLEVTMEQVTALLGVYLIGAAAAFGLHKFNQLCSRLLNHKLQQARLYG